MTRKPSATICQSGQSHKAEACQDELPLRRSIVDLLAMADAEEAELETPTRNDEKPRSADLGPDST